MKSIRITAIIEEVCKKQGIEYRSPNHSKLVEFKKDIDKLIKIYLDLKDIEAYLYELSDKYKSLEEVKKMIDQSIKAIDTIDHEIKNEAFLLSKKYRQIRNKKK